MGLLITVAEPDLTVLANQVKDVLGGTLLIVAVGVGVGIFPVLSVIKMVFHKPLSSMLLYFYMILFALAALVAAAVPPARRPSVSWVSARPTRPSSSASFERICAIRPCRLWSRSSRPSRTARVSPTPSP